MSKTTNVKKAYAVVKFIKAGSFSEIPSNWLLHDHKNKTTCRWPDPKVQNISKKVKDRVNPSEDWPIFEVKVLRYCDTLESAREAAADSQYSSAPEKLGRGRRKKKVIAPVRNVLNLNQNKILSSSSEDDNDGSDQAPAVPTFPARSLKDPPSKRIDREDSDAQESVRSLTEYDDLSNSVEKSLARARALLNSHETDEGRPEVPVSPTPTNYSATDAQSSRFDIIEEKLDRCLRLLGKLVTEVVDLKQRKSSNTNGNSGFNSAVSDEVDTHLKLDTRDAVTAFEEKLASSTEFEIEFIRKVKQVGGASGKDFTERALAFIFTHNFAKNNTWEGKITKYKVNNLKVVEICEKIVLDKFPSFDKAEFSKAGTNWFRLGNQRAGSQPKQVIKKIALAQTAGNQATNNQNI